MKLISGITLLCYFSNVSAGCKDNGNKKLCKKGEDCVWLKSYKTDLGRCKNTKNVDCSDYAVRGQCNKDGNCFWAKKRSTKCLPSYEKFSCAGFNNWNWGCKKLAEGCKFNKATKECQLDSAPAPTTPAPTTPAPTTPAPTPAPTNPAPVTAAPKYCHDTKNQAVCESGNLLGACFWVNAPTPRCWSDFAKNFCSNFHGSKSDCEGIAYNCKYEGDKCLDV